jgi:site-specific DNA-methyltransferase (adenine-specific)
MELNNIYLGDCLEVLKTLPDNSIDAIVTDPPYGLVSITKRFGGNSKPAQFGEDGSFSRLSKGFMGKNWDGSGIENNVDMWRECFRVLKPGGHLLSFGGTRTYHRIVCAIEDAGFEIRDLVVYGFGSGFPKGTNVGKLVDKELGNEREVVGSRVAHDIRGNALMEATVPEFKKEVSKIDLEITKGNTEWEGWNIALKPALEPICLAKKPISERNIAKNVLKWGVGALNIPECRVGEEKISVHNAPTGSFAGGEPDRGSDTDSYREHFGRYPANFIHDGSEEVVSLFPETKGKFAMKKHASGTNKIFGKFERSELSLDNSGIADEGSAARYFYCAKPSKKERGSFNTHCTVKPLALMEYLVKLVTKEGQVVLDPFAGSGTTLLACRNTNRNFVGIEKEKEYHDIILKRLELEREEIAL